MTQLEALTPRQLPRAWRVGLPGLLTLAVTYGYGRYGYGLFLPQLRREFRGSAGLLGTIVSIGYLTELIVVVVVGRLSGRVAPRVPIVIGGLFAASGMALMASATSAGMLAVGVALAGTAPGWVWAPYSDAIDAGTRKSSRAQAISMVSSGTTFGVLVAGPAVVLVAPSGWRLVWAGAAAVALAVTVWNRLVLPPVPHPGPTGGPPRRQGARLLPQRGHLPQLRGARLSRRHRTPHAHPYRRERERAQRGGVSWPTPARARLLLAAFSSGAVGAAYWAYASVAVSEFPGVPTTFGPTPLFWTMIGAAGVLGVLTGTLVTCWGLRAVFATAQALVAASCLLLALPGPGWFAYVGAAALFGAGFMIGGTLLPLWSERVDSRSPTAGFSTVVVVMTLGSALGPALSGPIIDAVGPEPVFTSLAVAAVATMMVYPRTGDLAENRRET
ncbi:MFS transporter [Nocardia sp. NPDC004068]|uniref:MFS transporter n=1 Tax=Nocardia sp. NPDC004068 TaxID=3364303 RepID=UPI0036834FF8